MRLRTRPTGLSSPVEKDRKDYTVNRKYAKLQTPFIRTPAFGIKSPIFRFDTLEALSSFRNGSSNGEIICLAFDDEPIPPGRKYKILVLWPNHQHLGAFAQRRNSEVI
jgi:hypothetical protein